MFQFRRPSANGEDLDQTVNIAAPAATPDHSFADRMLRSTLGISMADMARLGQEAQAMVAAFDRRMSAIEASVAEIQTSLKNVEKLLAAAAFEELQRRGDGP